MAPGFDLLFCSMFFVGVNYFPGIFPLKARTLLASKCLGWAVWRLKLNQTDLEIRLGLWCSICSQSSLRSHCHHPRISTPHSNIIYHYFAMASVQSRGPGFKNNKGGEKVTR